MSESVVLILPDSPGMVGMESQVGVAGRLLKRLAHAWACSVPVVKKRQLFS